MKQYWKKFFSKMNNKILIYSLTMMVVSILGSSFVYRHINNQMIFDSISKVNRETSTYVESNIENVFRGINSYSKLIINNDMAQKLLENNGGALLEQQALLLHLNIMMETTDFISDIYLADLSGNMYIASRGEYKTLNDGFLSSKVVEKALNNQGSYAVHLEGGDFFEGYDGEKFVSFVRAIRDLNTMKIIGVLAINIPVSYLISDEETHGDGRVRDLYILSEGQVVAHTGILGDDPMPYEPILSVDEVYTSKQITENNSSYMVSSYLVESMDWHIVNVIDLNQTGNDSTDFMTATMIILAINVVFILLGVALFALLFVQPVKRMIRRIRSNGDNLEMIDLKSNIHELTTLESEYNQMIIKIKALIRNEINEQKILRQKELELLQSQIKPHFLYNTLDTIKLLSKKGESDKAFEAVSALGRFFRSSLGKGEETIRISDEIGIVVNYLKIQQFRYKDMFEVKTAVDPHLKDCKILRLVLQPLVENALYHGIRPKGESGTISVVVKEVDEHVEFIVEDDGVGFDVAVLEGTAAADTKIKNGYGLRNTIERLKIFYGDDVTSFVESKKGDGTKVTISVPLYAMNPDYTSGDTYGVKDNE